MLDAIERRNTAVRRARGSTLTLSRDRVSRLVIHTYEPCKPTASIPEKAQPPPCCSARLEEVAEAGVTVQQQISMQARIQMQMEIAHFPSRKVWDKMITGPPLSSAPAATARLQ